MAFSREAKFAALTLLHQICRILDDDQDEDVKVTFVARAPRSGNVWSATTDTDVEAVRTLAESALTHTTEATTTATRAGDDRVYLQATTPEPTNGEVE